MNDRLTELYKGVAVHATANYEHTAALELLALVMAADHNLDEAEIEAIKDITDDWRDGDFTFDKYLGPAVERAQQAIADGEVVELIDDIDRRISSRVLRRALFSAAREVAGIDDDVSPEEGTILAEVAVRFG
ncbi:tellurite resistance protein TerB [Ilumatobacter fluminis]|uniref:Tellurite resistance protein TerB n=1 Tax=Ilumatobacter fluminis TaxID=467091 RepID=A0A4R7I0C8_9ACTN|nr:TerB family tellurite resistance protein [Ilumatobacter fluminis]TDT16977.1 tellurite resistance protein TerB [Ilumatobacter fluminis]